MASPPCGNCKSNIFYDDESIHCDGDCKSFFHKKCVNMSQTEYSNYYGGNGKWYCNKPNCVKLNKSSNPRVSYVISILNQLLSKVNSISALAPEIIKVKGEIVLGLHYFDQQLSSSEQNSKVEVEELNTLCQKVENISDAFNQLIETKEHGLERPILYQPRIQVGTLIVDEISYDIYKGENVIGRDELSDIVLRNHSISNKHAVVEVEDWDTHLLFDCGSTNKTKLGTIFLKPNVRYNLQGGEDIMFANLKAKYIKLDKPESDKDDEDRVSDAGSESILNSAPVDQGADLDIVNNDQPNPQVQDNNAEDASLNGSNILSDLNDSSLLEENQQKASSSKLQVVDASDDSTDDEVDFIPPSQTVKEFASKKQLALKNKCINDLSSDIFLTENAVLNSQEQEMFFMTEKTDCNKVLNLPDLNTQSLFSSEVQESLKSNEGVIYDQSIFEAETQDSVFDQENNDKAGPSRASRDIFDADTEVPEASASGEDVDMSDLELSNALTVSSVATQKPDLSNTDQVKYENKINTSAPNIITSLVRIKTPEETPVAEITQKAETNDSTSVIEPNLTNNIINIISKVKEEIPDPDYTGNEADQSENLTQVCNNSDVTDLSDVLTQVNTSLNTKSETSSINLDLGIDDICTQVNTSLKVEVLKNLVIKKEFEDNLNFTAEETQLNINLEKKKKTNKNRRTSKTGNTRMVEDRKNVEMEETQLNLNLEKKKKTNKNRRTSKTGNTRMVEDRKNVEMEETQLNLHIYSLFSESREVDITDLPTSHQQDKNLNTQDSDSTDVEDDNNLLLDELIQGSSMTRGQRNMSNIVDPSTIKTNYPKTKIDNEMDENSNQSDSLLASVSLDPELLQQEQNPHTVIESYSERANQNCASNLKPSQTVCEEGLEKNQQEIVTGDMDICSTVGDGTYLSACGSLRKAQNISEMKINQFEKSSRKITSGTKKLVLDQKKVSETESLNHSMVFNEPCSSSTPFRTEERIIKNYNNVKAVVVKTPPRGIFERVIDSPDLPCTDELMEVACNTPERQGTSQISESSQKRENLPLALKRTPRARKLSRKVAEALEDQQQKGATLIPSTLVSKNTNTKNVLVTDNPNGEFSDIFPENHERKKKILKRKPFGQQRDCTEAERNKSIDDSNVEVLKQNDCVTNLSVTLTDINSVQSKKTDTNQFNIEDCSPAKRAKNMDVEENHEENPIEDQSVIKEISTDKRQKKPVDQLEFKEKNSGRAIKTPNKQPKDKNGGFHGYDANLKENESGGKPKNVVNKLAYKNQEKNTSVGESSIKYHLLSSIITNNTDRSNDRCESSSHGEKLHPEIIYDHPSIKQLKDIEENPTSEDDQQCDKPSMRTKLGSRSSTLTKSAQLIKGDISNTVVSSIMRKSNRAGVKKTLSKKELHTDSKSPKNKTKPEHVIDVDIEPSNIDKNIVPLKRSKTVEDPHNSHSKKINIQRNTKKKDQKSAENVTEDAVKFTIHSLGMKNIDNNRRQSKPGKKLTRAKGKEEKDINEMSSSENPNKYKTFSEADIRKSNRRKKEGIVDTSSKKESKDECKFLNTITKPASELASKSKSKDNLIEKPEATTRKSNRKNKEDAMKPDVEKETSESETHSKLLNENNNTSNPKNKTKTKGRWLDESVEVLSLKTKSGGKDSNEDMLENSTIVDDHQEKLTRCRKTARSRVKPARYKDGIHGSSSSCIGSDTGPSLSKRRRGRHDSTSMEPVNSTMPGGDKTKSNEEHSEFIAPSKSTSRNAKKHSEVFKTPVIEERSRSRVGNEKSRSRSRSDSSRSSLRSDTSSIQSPRRLGARGKRVLFTSGLINPTWESQVKKLGGSVEDCPVECALLVADKVRRTVKFLCVLGQGKPIVSPDWLIQSWRCTSFIEPMDHLLIDKEAEDKFKFSLSRTIQAAGNQPLLTGYHIHATPSVKPPPEDIKSIVESCGGEYLEKVPSKWPANTVIISHVDDMSLWKKFKVKGVTPPIVAAEMLLIGVLQHKLEIEPHRIS